MESTKPIFIIAAAVAVFALPSIVLAVEAAGSGEAGSAGSVTAPAPSPATVDSWSFGESRPTVIHEGAGAGRESPTLPKKPMIRESPSRPSMGKTAADQDGDGKPDIVAPRDAASGLPTGKRLMNASGTMPEKTQERMQEAKEKMAERIQDRMQDFAKKTIARMRAAVDRLAKLIERIESRLAKMAENGKSIDKATPLLAKAKASLGEARAELKLAEEAIASAAVSGVAGSSTRPTNQPGAVKEHLKKAEAAIRAAHKAIADAVGAIRVAAGDIKADGKAKATTTTTTAAGGTTAQ